MRFVALIAVVVAVLAIAPMAMAEAPAPLALSNRDIGGGALNQYTPGVENGVGVNNIGLLIRTWGKVTFVDTIGKCFYIDDGSARNDGSGRVGIRVSYDNLAPGNSITPPNQDSYVTITGISSTVVIEGKIQPNLRPRRDADIQTVSQ